MHARNVTLSLPHKLFPALTKENVTVVTEHIEEFTAKGIETTSGEEHSVDAVILATGFDVLGSIIPFPLIGRMKKSFKEQFGDCPRAFLGVAYPGTYR